jgi:uncharacterized membrane protein YsdA (DUF1294 family)
MKPFTFFYGAAFFIFAATFAELSLIWLQPFYISWLGAANIAAFILCAFDKSAARGGSMRVPEKVLLVVAILGGSLGLLVAMNLFRHKTKKASFQLILIAILIIQFAALRLFVSQ